LFTIAGLQADVRDTLRPTVIVTQGAIFMPSFDIVSEVDIQEVRNAVDQTNREIGTRYDFKGTDASVELSGEDKVILRAESDFQLQQMADIFKQKIVKRELDILSFKFNEAVVNLSTAQQDVTVNQGIESAIAKKIVKLIKDGKLKVQTSIQGDQLRVTGKKRDDLQSAMALLRESKVDLPLQYTNFRD